jgi:CheY-like chemotaxis protein
MAQGGILTIKAENVLVDNENLNFQSNRGNQRYVLFSVMDTGPALTEEQLEDIFSANYVRQANPVPGDFGLFSADIIVKTHGGQIRVAGEIDFGTVFKVYLPAAPGSAIDVAAEKAVPLGHNECIMVVDDEEAILTITRQILEASGYQVITAENGADALSAYMQDYDKIALVIMDMNMPYLNGALAIHALRKMNPGIKIIATSGLHTQSQATRALQAGAESFIPKPLQTYDLLRSIDEALKLDALAV